ncbi:MAG: hypothetical protein ACE5DU_08355 [Nitrosopumilus sp.]
MENSIITCIYCKVVITEYYDDGYKGARGKCPSCGVDFPLE